MTPNPYNPPAYNQTPAMSGPVRSAFVMAAIGAWAAALYWAAIFALIGLGAVVGTGSMVNMILPLILIVLYALRGFQALKGDARALIRLLWLHGIGGLVAASQVASSSGIASTLQGIKVVIHIVGGVATLFAFRSVRAAARGQS